MSFSMASPSLLTEVLRKCKALNGIFSISSMQIMHFGGNLHCGSRPTLRHWYSPHLTWQMSQKLKIIKPPGQPRLSKPLLRSRLITSTMKRLSIIPAIHLFDSRDWCDISTKPMRANLIRSLADSFPGLFAICRDMRYSQPVAQPVSPNWSMIGKLFDHSHNLT